MQITIWVSSISFHAFADIKFQSTSDVSTDFLVSLYIAQLVLSISLVSEGGSSFMFLNGILLSSVIVCC